MNEIAPNLYAKYVSLEKTLYSLGIHSLVEGAAISPTIIVIVLICKIYTLKKQLYILGVYSSTGSSTNQFFLEILVIRLLRLLLHGNLKNICEIFN